MRIEAYNKVSQLYKTNQKKAVSNIEKEKRLDEVQISNIGKEYQLAKQAVKDSPDVREELVSSLKSSMGQETYRMEEGSFADKLLQKYEQSFNYEA